MMKWLCAVTLAVFGGSACLADGPLRVVADEWAPFGGENLPNGGISLDVITNVLTRAGYEVTTEIVPFERALSGAQSGDYDIVGNLFNEDTIGAYMDFSDPFYDTEVRFAQRIGTEHPFETLEDLRPYSIAVGAGYLYSPEFDADETLNKVTVTTIEQGVRMVAAGRVHLTLDSVDVVNFMINQAHPELATQIEILPFVVSTQQIHMGVREDLENRDQVLADFNRVLAQMRADGSLEAVLDAHRY